MNIENIIQILKSEIEYEKNTIKQNREHLSIRLDVLNDYLNGKNASGYVMDIEDTSRKIVKSLEKIKEKNNIIYVFTLYVFYDIVFIIYSRFT